MDPVVSNVLNMKFNPDELIPYNNRDSDFIKNKKKDSIRKLFDILKYNNYSEEITQFEHMAQAANLAIRNNPDDYEMIVAAFLHDIMHSVNPEDEYGNTHHDKMAHDFLTKLGFPSRICKLILNHTVAKRYKVTMDVNYYNTLSHASKITFERQGGILNYEQVEQFENDILFDDYLKLREFDDNAKYTQDQILDKRSFGDDIDEIQDFEYYFQYVCMFI